MNFSVEFRPAARRELERLPREVAARIVTRIEALAADPLPRDSKKLKGTPWFRIRVGSYRVVYDVQKEKLLVIVIRVRHRGEAYRRLFI